MAILVIFIIIANIVSIVLMYHCLEDLDKKEKWIFIGAGTGIIYILTSIVYWISTKGIEVTEVSEMGKNLITFIFVPVNSILVLPLLAKSYVKFKDGRLGSKVFFSRGIVLGIILLIVLVLECIYFKNIQVQVVELIKSNRQQTQNSSIEDDLNVVENQNIISNEVDNNITNNEINTNEMKNNNVDSNESSNEISDNETAN